MRELLPLIASALTAHRLRTGLSLLGVAIGVFAVLLLTSIGEGTRTYIIAQFTQFGTNLLSVHPGKTETFGIPGVLGGTTHKLTIDDAEALRRVRHVDAIVPLVAGQARVEGAGRGRSVMVYGVGPEMPGVWKFDVRQGSFLPPGDPRRGAQVAVLGPTLKEELFGTQSALGRFVRIAGARLRVIGVMAPKGRILGMDIDDVAYVPVATGMRLFNQQELMEIHVSFSHVRHTDEVAAGVRAVLTERHGGNEDFTVTTQQAMLDVFGNVMTAITSAMGAIGAISLLVGAIGILTTMWIAVGERTSEIGLLRALGATSRQVLAIFLAEATLLAFTGGGLGVAAGLGASWLLGYVVPGLPLETPPLFMAAALVVSIVTGLCAGVLPARRAALLDPIEALRAE